MEAQKIVYNQTIFRKRSNFEGVTIPNFKLCCRNTITKTAWNWHKTKHVDQWNRIEYPDINSCSYDHLIFKKDTKTYFGEKTIFQTNGSGKLDIYIWKTKTWSLRITLYKNQQNESMMIRPYVS
jgi:hypothetical protein